MKGEDLILLKEVVLADCKPEFAFWMCNGNIERNVYELLSAIKASDDWVFKYHVNFDNHKNDFAKWIRDALGDKILADRLENILDKNRYIKVIERRIKQLELA
ncbi:MAG: DUF5752 family protein [archaeon]